MINYLHDYGNTNPNKFSKELLTLREKDDILEYLFDISKALEAIDGIKFLGGKIETDESKFKPRMINKEPEKFWRNIKESRLNLVNLNFSVESKDEKQLVTLPLYVPKLINNMYYEINGNKYFAVYQLVDSSTYNNKDKVTLKSLLMPIVLKRNSYVIEDVNGKEYKTRIYALHLFSFKINFLYYYFSKFGFSKTLKFFGVAKSMLLSDNCTPRNNTLYFQISSNFYLKVRKDRFYKDQYFRSIVASTINALNGNSRLNREKIEDTKFWKNKLGSFYTKNVSNRVEKAETVLKSFYRILDDRTKKCLRIMDKDKKNTYTIVRWMIRNFNSLLKKDNLSLLTKRIRLSEYIVTPFLRRMSDKTYNLLNNKNKTLDKKLTLFKNISPMYIIQKMLVMDMIRYNGSVNVLNLFTTLLKYSSRGPQSQSENGKKSVSIAYRGLHPSYLGRIDLNSCTKNDPGKLIASV